MAEWRVNYKLVDTGDPDYVIMRDIQFSKEDASGGRIVHAPFEYDAKSGKSILRNDQLAHQLTEAFIRNRGFEMGEANVSRRSFAVTGNNAADEFGGFEGHNLAPHEIMEEIDVGNNNQKKRKKRGS